MTPPPTTPLTAQQQALLLAIFSFRFCTPSLLATYCNIPNTASLRTEIQTLEDNEYIAALCAETHTRLDREPDYYMTPVGLKLLRRLKLISIPESTILMAYKDVTSSLNFVNQHLLIMRLSMALADQYDNLQLATARDTADRAHFPSPPPGLFLALGSGRTAACYLLDIAPVASFSSWLPRRIKYYNHYFASGEWQQTNLPTPHILFVTESVALENTLHRYIRREQKNTDQSISYHTTTQGDLLSSTSAHRNIWITPDSKSPQTLEDIASDGYRVSNTHS